MPSLLDALLTHKKYSVCAALLQQDAASYQSCVGLLCCATHCRVLAGCGVGPTSATAPTALCVRRSSHTTASHSQWNFRMTMTWFTWPTATPSPGQTSRTTYTHCSRQAESLWAGQDLHEFPQASSRCSTCQVLCVYVKPYTTQDPVTETCPCPAATMSPLVTVPTAWCHPATHCAGQQLGGQHSRPAHHHCSSRQGQAAQPASGSRAVR